MTDGRILTHAGAGSDPEHADATRTASEIAREALATGSDALEAACHAVAHLEDDPRFNAGTGSYVRSDGRTVEMDAACMADDGRFGAVACLERVRHPVFVARYVVDTEHLLLAGNGARRFARRKGVPDWDPRTAPDAAPASDEGPGEGTDRSGPGEDRASDTVGCVLYDGERFAAALSSGGTEGAPPGRVGDVPLPGAGLHVGPAGAVAATGHGESIARRLIALRAYERLENGRTPEAVVAAVLEGFPEERSLGLIVTDGEAGAGGSNRTMAWSQGTA